MNICVPRMRRYAARLGIRAIAAAAEGDGGKSVSASDGVSDSVF